MLETCSGLGLLLRPQPIPPQPASVPGRACRAFPAKRQGGAQEMRDRSLSDHHCTPLGADLLCEPDFSTPSQYLMTITDRGPSRGAEQLEVLLIPTVPWPALVSSLLLPPASLRGQEDRGRGQKRWTSGREGGHLQDTLRMRGLVREPANPTRLCLETSTSALSHLNFSIIIIILTPHWPYF